MVREQRKAIIRLETIFILSLASILLPAMAKGMSLDTMGAAGTQRVILVTPNLDDDDNDGKPDAEDIVVNGPKDRDDLTAIEVPLSEIDCIPVIEGGGAALYRVLDIKENGLGKSTVYLEAKGPRSSSSAAKLKFKAKSPSSQDISFHLDVKPFTLMSSVDQASEVFIVRVPNSVVTIEGLKNVLMKIPNAPVLTVLDNENGTETDVWVQDSTEIGFIQGTTMSAAFAGLRGKHNNFKMNPKVLDQYFAKTFCGPNRCVLAVGQPLPARRWIDWFGNLESTPPFIDQDGNESPWGRVLVGQQKELAMHDAVMDFLEDQGVQWPPIALDTGFLLIGHVDEIVNFIPTKTGFKAIVASPKLGWELLKGLVQDGHGDEVMQKGLRSLEMTVAMAWNDAELNAANDAAAKVMAKNQKTLMREMNFKETDIIEMPVVFTANGLSLWPNPVNGLVIENHYIASKPFGPLIDGGDPLEKACRAVFEGTDIVVHFIDAYNAYSRRAGEVHCGTNAVRQRVLR